MACSIQPWKNFQGTVNCESACLSQSLDMIRPKNSEFPQRKKRRNDYNSDYWYALMTKFFMVMISLSDKNILPCALPNFQCFQPVDIRSRLIAIEKQTIISNTRIEDLNQKRKTCSRLLGLWSANAFHTLSSDSLILTGCKKAHDDTIRFSHRHTMMTTPQNHSTNLI